MNCILSTTLRPRPRRWTAIAVGLLLGLAGCGLDTPDSASDHDHDHSHGESDMRLGSSARGGGELGLDYDFRQPVHLDCEEIAGLAFCSAEDPGFVPLEGDEQVFFQIAHGTAVSIELTAIDPGARVVIRDTTLDAAGESTVLGSSEEELHVHPQWQVVADPNELDSRYRVSFKLTTFAPPYEESEVYTVSLSTMESTE